MKRQSILVAGGGIAGLIMAHALLRLDIDLTLIEPYAPKQSFDDVKDVLNGRTAMILNRHVEWLTSIAAWGESLSTRTAPLSTMRIIDDSISSKAPALPVDFCSKDLRQTAFGYNTPLTMFRAYLWDNLPKSIRVLESHDDTKYDLRIAADGRNSPLRETAGITANFEDCDRYALTFVIEHSWEHHNISTELQKPEGPITLVPLSNQHQSSVVFTGTSSFIKSLQKKDKIDISNILYKYFEDCFFEASINIVTDIQSHPLSFMHVNQLYKDNIVLTAEAAHVLHPLGAQGLNLSIGDMHTLYNLIEESVLTGQSVASPIHVLEPYAKQRSRAHIIRHIGIQSSLSMLEKGNITGVPRRFILNTLRKHPTLKRMVMAAQK